MQWDDRKWYHDNTALSKKGHRARLLTIFSTTKLQLAPASLGCHLLTFCSALKMKTQLPALFQTMRVTGGSQIRKEKDKAKQQVHHDLGSQSHHHHSQKMLFCVSEVVKSGRVRQQGHKRCLCSQTGWAPTREKQRLPHPHPWTSLTCSSTYVCTHHEYEMLTTEITKLAMNLTMKCFNLMLLTTVTVAAPGLAD